jgi:hypothetical protein
MQQLIHVNGKVYLATRKSPEEKSNPVSKKTLKWVGIGVGAVVVGGIVAYVLTSNASGTSSAHSLACCNAPSWGDSMHANAMYSVPHWPRTKPLYYYGPVRV